MTTTAIRSDDRKITVLVAEDHDLVHEGYSRVLGRDPNIILIPEAIMDGDFLEPALTRHHPQVLILDLHMPNFDPLPSIRKICDRYDAPKVIVVTSKTDPIYVRESVDAGVSGYLIKEEGTTYMIRNAIQACASGGTYYSPKAHDLLFGKPTLLGKLSDIELAILRLMDEGKGLVECKAILGKSEDTIYQAARRLRQKLGATNNLEAVAIARKHGLLYSSE